VIAPARSASSTATTPAGRQFVERLSEPLRRYLRTESGSAGLLLLATLVALAWANSPWNGSYETFWHTELAFRLGDWGLALDLQHWVNDGLMVFFFFVVGLEVKRELSIGELTDRHRAAVPLVAALTGLAVPALVFLLFNPSGPEARGWGVVISTDTAFLLGVLALVGPRCSAQLRLFLLTLAVADDVGALTIIALVYTDDLDPVALALAAGGIGAMLTLTRLAVWRGPAYFVLAVGVWLAMYESGVHPTIAGVVIALLTPAYAPRPDEVEQAEQLARSFRQSPNPEFGRAARLAFERAVSSNERLQRLYHPWSSYVIVPIFALANAGVTLDRETIEASLRSPLSLGIVAGLVLGKLVGITLGTVGAIRLRIGTLGRGLDMLQLAGGAVLSGIGFTISLFIVDLALDDPELQDQARLGVLAASALAAGLGWLVFLVGGRLRVPDPSARRAMLLDRPVDPRRDHIRGPADAPLTLVEYGDFQCPFCGAATGSIEDVRAQLGDRLRYVFRHLPLTDVHPDAELAAHAAEAAGAQGRFWEMHDRLFAHQDALDLPSLLRYADELGLDVDRFGDELRDGVHERRIAEDTADAEASGVEGTPTFFIGERRHIGPYDALTITRALGAETATDTVPRPVP
jgi:Na+/H+ antiporter NhaA